MKQHITVEQLQEISKEQIISLFKDFEQQVENFAPFEITEEEWYMHFAEQMNIGKMIELLQGKDKNGEYWLIGKIECRPYNGGKPIPGTVSWVIHMIKQGTFEVKVFDECFSKELINVLWQTVKEALL